MDTYKVFTLLSVICIDPISQLDASVTPIKRYDRPSQCEEFKWKPKNKVLNSTESWKSFKKFEKSKCKFKEI